MWFENYLQNKKNCIIVKDVSRIPEAIQWCEENEKQCEKIIKNGLTLYKTMFEKEGLYDYMALVLNNLT